MHMAPFPASVTSLTFKLSAHLQLATGQLAVVLDRCLVYLGRTAVTRRALPPSPAAAERGRGVPKLPSAIQVGTSIDAIRLVLRALSVCLALQLMLDRGRYCVME